jgi:hypothetical protein
MTMKRVEPDSGKASGSEGGEVAARTKRRRFVAFCRGACRAIGRIAQRSRARAGRTQWFRPPTAAVNDREVRAEIWRLGSRHRGKPLTGALNELRSPNLPAGRAQLLRACVHKLQSSRESNRSRSTPIA